MIARLRHWLRRPARLRVWSIGQDVLAPLPDVRHRNYVLRDGGWRKRR